MYFGSVGVYQQVLAGVYIYIHTRMHIHIHTYAYIYIYSKVVHRQYEIHQEDMHGTFCVEDHVNSYILIHPAYAK